MINLNIIVLIDDKPTLVIVGKDEDMSKDNKDRRQ